MALEGNGMILLSLVNLKVFSSKIKLSDQYFNGIILVTVSENIQLGGQRWKQREETFAVTH